MSSEPDKPLLLTTWERCLRPRINFRSAVGTFLVATLAVSTVATSTGAVTLLPPHNPAANLAPSPNFFSSGNCLQSGCANPCVRLTGSTSNRRPVFPKFNGSPTCTDFVLRALNAARSNEGLQPIELPTNWYRLKPQEQIFVIVDLERTSRGLPPYVGLNRQLHATAQFAASHQVDPTFAAGFRVGLDPQGVLGMGGALAKAFTTLAADYVWMYDDGWGGTVSATPNLACSFAGALGCWAHRDQLLGFDGSYNFGVGLRCTTCEMGTGFAIVHGTATFVSLIELPAGPPPPMYFTWAKNVQPYLVTTQSAAG